MRRDPSTRATALAVGAVFFLNGATFSSWLPRIPEVRNRLGVGVGTLGVALLGAGLGGLVGSILSGLVVHRLGSRNVAVVTGSALSLLLSLVAVVPGPYLLLAALLVMGCFDALTDIAMNAQAVQVQRRWQGSVMNRFHAGWSLGSVAGTTLGSVAAGFGVGVGTHLLAVGVVLVAGLAVARRWLLAVDDPIDERGERGEAAPRSRGRWLPAAGLLIAGLALATAVVEATPMEWAAVFLSDELGAGTGLAGVGVVSYSAAMFVGRVVGDPAIDRMGAGRVLNGAVALVAVGLVLAVLTAGLAVTLVGFALWGLGVSVLFPLLYGASGTLPGVARSQGLALMTTGQRIGFLAGPPLVGRLGGLFSLPVAFLVAAGAAVTLLVLSLPRLTAATNRAVTGQPTPVL